MDEINLLIRQCKELIKQCKKPKKKEILIKKLKILITLKGLNKQAYKFMLQPYKSYKQKYRLLQGTRIWSEARKLLYAYFLKDNKLFCGICNNYIDNNFTLHHEVGFYHKEELFTPSFTSLIHFSCHKKRHNK